MLIAAIIIYIILAFLIEPLWIINFIAGKAGCVGVVITIAWAILLIAGIAAL